MGKPKFSPGMSSSASVRNTVSKDTLTNNNIDTGYNLKFIPIEKIKPNKLNADFSQEEIDTLRYSIEINGLFHALVVIPDYEKDEYRLVSGERRYRALSSIDTDKRNALFPIGIPCKTESKKEEEDEIDEEIKLREANIQQRNYTPEEKTKHIRRLLELYQIKQERGEIKSAVKEIMKAYNINERMARRYVAANKMIPQLRNILDQGTISLSESEKFATFSEEAQHQIVNLINSNGKVEKTDLELLRKTEEANKQLEEDVLKVSKELANKNQMIEELTSQLTSLKEEISKDTVKSSKTNNNQEAKERIAALEQLLDKESKERKRVQSNLERVQKEAEENRTRNISASKDELKRIADYAKAENIHDTMFKQLKELEKLQNTIKQDATLKVNFAIIAQRLSDLFE